MCCSKHTGNGDLERSRQGKDKGQQKRAEDERGEEDSVIVIQTAALRKEEKWRDKMKGKEIHFSFFLYSKN